MAALLTRRCNDIKEITKLMDECKSMGIPVYGPDVNESYANFGVNKNGEIRFGLAAIKGMSEAATRAIIEERTKNGPFKDLYDFVERIPPSALNKKVMECMALAGALDTFGVSREQYLVPPQHMLSNPRIGSFIDALLVYAQQFYSAKMEAQNSLFGGLEAIEITKPKPGKALEWSAIERLNRERELVGIYLSAHPLDEYAVILNCICNTTCSELGRDADRAELAKRDMMVFGGIVTNVREGFTKKGSLMGIVTIEDFAGVGELALFGEEWSKWVGKFRTGCSVLVKMKSVEHARGGEKYYMFEIHSVDFLNDVADNAVKSITINIDMDVEAEKDGMLEDLSQIIMESVGDTNLSFVIRDSRVSPQAITMSSDIPGIKINRKLMDFVQAHESIKVSI
jgi:DNA polymerase-3 subunit alpha